MALTTLAALQYVPGMQNLNSNWLAQLLSQADTAIKKYLKRDIETATYTEYYSGSNQNTIVLRQRPCISITNIWIDPTGAFGAGPSAFSGTPLTQGTQYALYIDRGSQSDRALVVRIGGVGAGFIGYYPETYYQGKLAARQLPAWPFGVGNIKVVYVAGYATVPDDLAYACQMLVAYMVRNLPSGAPLQNESLGAYSYSVLQAATSGQAPELGGLARTLARYRESSW